MKTGTRKTGIRKPWIMLTLIGCLLRPSSTVADAVTDWNAISVPVVQAGRPGGIGFVDFALVQAAVHDAVQAIEGRFEPYHVKISGVSGSPAAAVAAAAYGVLTDFYPDQAAALTATYQAYLMNKNLVNDPGLAVGQMVAAGIVPLRRLDPSPLPAPFLGGTNPGDWHQQSGFNPGGPIFRTHGKSLARLLSQPFTLKSPSHFALPRRRF